MIYGFPGNTQEYILSDAVAYIAERSDPAKIAVRTGRLDIISAAQECDPALRIHYAAKHASIANAWKKWQGEALGIGRLRHRGRETRLRAGSSPPVVRGTVPNTAGVVAGPASAEYARIADAYFAREITRETLGDAAGSATPPRSGAEAALRPARVQPERALWRHGVPASMPAAARAGLPARRHSCAEGVARQRVAGSLRRRGFRGTLWREGADSAAVQPAVRLREETERMLGHIGVDAGNQVAAQPQQRPPQRTLHDLHQGAARVGHASGPSTPTPT